MPIMTHSHPLPPRTGIQLVTSSFFVSLLVLEIRPLERLLVSHCKNGGVFEIRFFNRLTNTTLLLFAFQMQQPSPYVKTREVPPGLEYYHGSLGDGKALLMPAGLA